MGDFCVEGSSMMMVCIDDVVEVLVIVGIGV